MKRKLAVVYAAVLASGIWLTTSHGQSETKGNLEGAWEASRYRPIVEGTLDIVRSNERWSAQIEQYDVPVSAKGDSLSFELPGDQGRFDGHVTKDRSMIRGHWIQPTTIGARRKYASPVILKPRGTDHWQGDVVPLKDEFTLYLVLNRRPDGSLAAVIRNPDRNIGIDWRLDRLEREGNRLKLIGKTSEQARAGVWPVTDQLRDIVIAEGVYHSQHNRISLSFERGGTYDFSPVTSNPASGFHARVNKTYQYKAPVAEDDGWPVGTLEGAGMSSEPIAAMVRYISTPFMSLDDPYVHGILVARHGKLVIEEYFYGFHRGIPHDTRSASKSLTATLVGAAIQNGAKLDSSTRVYDLLYKGALPKDLDPRKKEMTVEHLLNMASGYDCDDRAYPPRPGGEGVFWNLDTDFYQHALNLPMVSKPGERTAYCSINPNLLGAVLTAATNQPLTDLFQNLIAEPLQLGRYHMRLQPTGEPYMGGGIYWLPRDFLKIGQLMLNDGEWNGKRILSKEWVRRASTPMVKIMTRGSTNCVEGSTPTLCLRNYGYLWWHFDFPYQGRTVHAYYAGGNGGQSVSVIPELDMVVATWAGNYTSLVGLKVQEELIPKFILPAIKSAASQSSTRDGEQGGRLR
jgi:CubicO group peptidase (beta-lactamase class C family)